MYDLASLLPTILTIVTSVALAAIASYTASATRNSEQASAMREEIAAIKAGIDALRISVEKHNAFAERIPELSVKMEDARRDITDLFGRVSALERGRQ